MTAPHRAPRLAVVAAGTGVPSSTGLLADRLGTAVSAALAERDAAPHVDRVELRDLATAIAGALVTQVPDRRLTAALDTVRHADALIVVTPVYNASYSGLFKSFFDLLRPEDLAGTPLLAAATGGTPRHSLVIDHALRPLFGYLRAVTVPTGVYAATADFGSHRGAAAEGEAPLAERIARAAGELAELTAGRLPAPDAPHGAAGGHGAHGVDRRSAPHGADGVHGPDGAHGPDGEDAPADPGLFGPDGDLPEVVPFAQQLAAVRRG
ncbi:CE1759 family FMN reductase [Streptomyces lonarensis]|uniref:Oxidoreductase n=1 Tax=Streptomyces lonarensis TaxID=700599 RepID=A0A7X6D0X5_9ACTN|nr:CE1759 family FMN reductase [Streptomyces lonarensis]NJQ06201.1 oxidoreductase [Streptomyces lonarensis]